MPLSNMDDAIACSASKHQRLPTKPGSKAHSLSDIVEPRLHARGFAHKSLPSKPLGRCSSTCIELPKGSILACHWPRTWRATRCIEWNQVASTRPRFASYLDTGGTWFRTPGGTNGSISLLVLGWPYFGTSTGLTMAPATANFWRPKTHWPLPCKGRNAGRAASRTRLEARRSAATVDCRLPLKSQVGSSDQTLVETRAVARGRKTRCSW